MNCFFFIPLKKIQNTKNTMIYLNGIFEEDLARHLFTFEARMNLKPGEYFELISNAKMIYIGYKREGISRKKTSSNEIK